MTDDLYEQYKDALRRGHIAVLRGQLEEAISAYSEASALAPARALPHTSLGGVYMRLNRVEEALAEYAAAVARAPQDEAALLGQADALAAVGRFEDAAAALDRVAQIQEAAGRLPEASDTLRRAMELYEEPERMRRQRGLQRQIRLSVGDQAAEIALARALRLREEPAPVQVRTAPLAAAEVVEPNAVETVSAEPEPAQAEATSTDAETVAGAPIEHAEPAPEPIEAAAVLGLAPELSAGVEAGPGVPQRAIGQDEPQPIVWESETAPFDVRGVAPAEVEELVEAAPPVEQGLEPAATPDELAAQAPEPEPDLELEPEAVAVMDTIEASPVIELPVARPNVDELLVAAEAAEAAGDTAEVRRLQVAAAREYAMEGRVDAGLDLAEQLIREHPADVDVHLVLVELYIARNWDNIAAEKLLLLGRLADLDGDEQARLRLCAAASQAFPANGRLASLCA